ncbi:MAG TPA: tetratricopeptide repeat protein [Bacteroidota bacterium]|nr:tetratricopeptide repeat protein [Bacteroidota bacterium]
MKPYSFAFCILCLCSAPSAITQAGADSISTVTRDSLLQAGIRQYSEARFNAAVQTLSSVPTDTSSARALFYLGLSYASLNDFQNAYDCLRHAVSLDSSDNAIRFQYARFLSQFGAVEEAQAQFERIVRSDTTFYPAYFQLGVLLNAQRKYPAREVEIFSRIVRYEPRDYLSLHFLGDALIRLGQFEAGRSCIATSVTLNPKHFPAVNQLAGLYFSKGDYNEALRLYLQAESLRPLDPNVAFNIGESYRKLRNDSAAVGFFEKAMMLDSTESKYPAQLGYAWFGLKLYDSSVTAYRRAIAIDNENPQYWLNLALVYQRMDSAERVVDAFEMAVSASRPDKIADIYSQLASFQFRQRDYRAAIKAYSKVLQFDPDLAVAHFYLGMSYDELKNGQDAARHYQTYLKLTEGDTTVTSLRGYARHQIDYLQKRK